VDEALARRPVESSHGLAEFGPGRLSIARVDGGKYLLQLSAESSTL